MGLYSDNLEETADTPYRFHVVGSHAQLSFQHLDHCPEHHTRRTSRHVRRGMEEGAKIVRISEVFERNRHQVFLGA